MVMKLGWVPRYDVRSREFHVKNVLMRLEPPRTNSWPCLEWLDQGELSACVGFSFAHFMASAPFPIDVSEQTGVNIYKEAQNQDDRPGTNYEGTSVLGGAKALQKLYPDLFDAYHWAFNIHDLVLALGYVGPVVMGLPWFSSMFNPDPSGVISVHGSMVGGHAILATGVDIEKQLITFRNSWGANWGVQGNGYIRFSEMEHLINKRAELCVITGKKDLSIVPGVEVKSA